MNDTDMCMYQLERLATTTLSEAEYQMYHQKMLDSHTQRSGVDLEMDAMRSILQLYQTATTVTAYQAVETLCTTTLAQSVISRPARVATYIRLCLLARWHIQQLESQ